MAHKITTALIENSYLLRTGLEELLKDLHNVQLVEVYDGSEKNLLQKVNLLKPDCLIINSEILEDSLNSFMLSLSVEIMVIGIIGDQTPDHVKSRFSNTLHLKDGKHELLNAISQITGYKNSQKNPAKNQLLTEREITILKHITRGLTNQEIAEKLFLSIHTVMTHRKNITKKLGIKTVSGLTVYALLNKIIQIQEIEQ